MSPRHITSLVIATLLSSGAFAQSPFDKLQFRSIGPAALGGRIHDIEVPSNDLNTIYIGAASGGIWKSTNKGTTWTPIFDNQAVSTFGDIAIFEGNNSIVWAGTGEQNNRQSSSWGNGVHRSTDGGATWTHLGLEETRHIGKIRLHRSDPNVAYVAALGNLWKASSERGVFKTTDAGRTWQKVLFVDTLTGVVDLVMD
ncbi:MAG: WD40/YVTN/BNR-like repeat-containing protein, partial [Vicinamibacterales bacterium]